MIGKPLGCYNVTAKLGAGGMGEVYRAHDTKLNRDVALKVLPASVAADPDRLARFRREAQVLAALNHPNIGHIYGFEEEVSSVASPGASTTTTHALVLELVEGPTLADRLAQAPIDLDEALAIARQIALALEAAHARGIIHRDLKPANIKVQPDGTVKVLDFGLAKALESVSASGIDSDNSPTLTNRATMMGVILGTAAYMAPEQAKGKVVDKRADVWSFGVVLYEILTGRRMFRGADVTDTIAEVLKTDPDWSALPGSTPASIRRLLRRCLERDREKRLHDIADARLEIDEASSGAAAPAEPMARPSIGRERWLWAVVTGALAVALAIMTGYRRGGNAPPPELQLQLTTPPFPLPGAPTFAVSPDGRTIAYLAITEGKQRIWLRQFDREDAHPLDGTEGAASVYWPDERSLVFHRGGTIQEIDAGGGVPRARPDLPGGGFGLSWNDQGVVLFAPANAAPISRLSAGAAPVPATRVVPPQIGHRLPLLLPDGKHFLYLATGPPEVQGIYVGSLDSLDAKRLAAADTAPNFLPPDGLLFGLADTLYAQRMDLASWTPVGKPVVVTDQVLQNRNVFGTIALATSRSNVIAYRKAIVPPHQLTWMDRSGRALATVGDVDTSEILNPTTPRVSPDGRTIAIIRRAGGINSVWTVENQPHGVMQRFTSNQASAVYPVWAPDSTRIAFQSSRRGGGFYDLYVKSFGGDGAESPLVESADNKTMNDWSRDNRFVLMTVQFHQAVQRDIWAIPISGDDRKPFPVSADPGDEIGGRFSPDSHWIAYQSNEGNGYDVYVRPFPGPGRTFQISSQGGVSPEWGRDGREVFYLSRDNHLMAVPVTLSTNGTVERGAPVQLFALRPGSGYSVGADGRFLVNLVLEDVPTAPINLIFNWNGRRQ